MQKLFLTVATLLFSLCVCMAQNEPMQTEDTTIFVVAEVAPEFPGGMSAIGSFLAKTMEYPLEARAQGITGLVFVSFIVEKDGAVSNVKVIKPLYPACDKAAVQGIRMMPHWTPAFQQGKAVRFQYLIPVRFQMNKSDIKKARKEAKKKQKRLRKNKSSDATL